MLHGAHRSQNHSKHVFRIQNMIFQKSQIITQKCIRKCPALKTGQKKVPKNWLFFFSKLVMKTRYFSKITSYFGQKLVTKLDIFSKKLVIIDFLYQKKLVFSIFSARQSLCKDGAALRACLNQVNILFCFRRYVSL